MTCSRAKKSLALVAYTDNRQSVKDHVVANGWFSEVEVDVPVQMVAWLSALPIAPLLLSSGGDRGHFPHQTSATKIGNTYRQNLAFSSQNILYRKNFSHI